MGRDTTLMHSWAAVMVAAGMALAVPVPARAADGTVGVTAGTLRFQAGPATANNVRILRDRTGDQYSVFEDPATALAATGCTAAFPGGLNIPEAVCPIGPIAQFAVFAGDGNDRVTLTPSPPGPVFMNTILPARISGGRGNDDLTAGDGPDVITTGPGVNTARGMGGDDRLLMRNGARDTLTDCGEGTDTAVVDKVKK